MSVWEIAARIISHPFLLPTIPETFSAMCKILSQKESYFALISTLDRVLASIAVGAVLGILLAVLSKKLSPIRYIVEPMISVMRSTPVTVISLLLYLLLPGEVAPIVVALFLIMPLIWQNVTDGYDSIDKNLDEVCEVFEFSRLKRFRYLVFPTLVKFFIPALVSSVGLAWKAVISGEILVHTADSIGEIIFDAKNSMLDSEATFAWTLLIITVSIVFEKLTKLIARRLQQCR